MCTSCLRVLGSEGSPALTQKFLLACILLEWGPSHNLAETRTSVLFLQLLLSSGKLAPEAQPATAAQGGSEVAKDEAPAGTIPEGGPVPVPGTPESQKKASSTTLSFSF